MKTELSKEKTVSFFKSADELASFVGLAVHIWENERRIQTLSRTANQEMLSGYNPSKFPDYPDMYKSNDMESILKPGADLEGANLAGSFMENADLSGADLTRAILMETDFKRTNLERANLKGTRDLTFNQLSQVKTLYNAKLDEELLIPLKEKYPNLFENPEDE